MRKEQSFLHWSAILAIAVICCFVLTSQAVAKTIKIRIGTYDPYFELTLDKTNGEFGSTTIKAQHFKSILEKTSGGKFEVEIFPNGQLGGDREINEMLKVGTLEASAYEGSMAVHLVPEAYAFKIPYLFKDLNVFMKVINGPVGDELKELILRRMGIRVMSWGFSGPYYNFMSAKKPIRLPSDLKGQKIRVPPGTEIVEIVKNAGGSPTPVAWSELYTSLQQGVVDGCMTYLFVVRYAKLDEILKYFSKADVVLIPSWFSVSEKFWQKLSPEERYLVKSAALRAMEVYEGMMLWGDDMWVESLRGKGLTVSIPTQQELKIWKDTLQPPMVEWARKKAGPEWVDKVLKAAREAEKELYGF